MWTSARARPSAGCCPSGSAATIGAWCFVDHFGPDDVAERAGMEVPPHPHIGLQTVTWLIDGEIVHRDSLGNGAADPPRASST